MDSFVDNIENLTEDNDKYRDILYTGTNMQLTVMYLKPGEDIPKEIHNGEQFIRIEEGRGEIHIGAYIYDIGPGDGIIIPRFTNHRLVNIGNKPLKLYSIYSPPQHMV